MPKNYVGYSNFLKYKIQTSALHVNTIRSFFKGKKIESKKLASVYKQFTRLSTMCMPRFDVKVRT